MNLGTIDLTQTPRQCILEDDPGMVVRGARPITAGEREALRERARERLIAQMLREAGRA